IKFISLFGEENRETAQVLAQTLDIQGSLELAKGNPKAALDAWKRAFEIYQDQGNLTNITQNQINQAQALQILGRYNRAVNILEQIAEYLDSQPNSAEKAIAFVSLGDVFRVIGNPDESQTNLENSSIQVNENSEESQTHSENSDSQDNENPNWSQTYLKKGLEIAEKLNLPEVQAAALISLGNLVQSQNRFNDPDLNEKAQNYYQQAAEVTTSQTTKIQAQLNQLNLSVTSKEWNTAKELQANIREQLKEIPPNTTAIYSKLNLVQSLMCFAEARTEPSQRQNFSPLLQSCLANLESFSNSEEQSFNPVSWLEIRTLTQEAIQDAQNLQNSRAQSYALGYLAATYQQTQDFAKAEKYTRVALELESISSYEAGEITYLLQWQLGRLQKAQQKNQTEIDPTTAYQVAFQTLNSLRRDLLEISSDVRYSFRDSIEPLYREYVDLLLKPEKPSLDNLKQARNVIEALQLAEINDFFQDACTEARPEEIDTIIDTTTTPTTIIYPIILEDRLEVILKLPGKDNFYHYRTQVRKQEVDAALVDFRRSLANPVERSIESEIVYNWLIRPAEEILAETQSTTLVFVLDGTLRK
ncbi:MAG: hypothetical protein SWJ54_24265, partial [Cyanobacteriota bacterium]|nr:hypothetical protein [Cyanobacteriota bacterium]